MEIDSLILVLGSPNDDDGNLSKMALARAKAALITYQKHPECKLLLTGGYGPGFNRTQKPHAFYLKKYLLSQGIPEDKFVEFALSSFTADDALKALPTVKKYNAKKLYIISSDFHMVRVRYIFDTVFSDCKRIYISAAYLDSCDASEQKRLIEHEKSTLANLNRDKFNLDLQKKEKDYLGTDNARI